MPELPDPRQARSGVAYAVLAAAIVVLAVAGYAGYVLYPRFDLPAGTGAGLLVLAAAAGIASFFSPCAFPLLVTLLARETGAADGREPRASPAAFGAALAVGAALFLAILGVGISFGGAALFSEVTFESTAGRTIRIVVGGLLILLGLFQANVIPVAAFGRVEYRVHRLLGAQAPLRRSRPVLAFGIYGFLYLLAGFG